MLEDKSSSINNLIENNNKNDEESEKGTPLAKKKSQIELND